MMSLFSSNLNPISTSNHPTTYRSHTLSTLPIYSFDWSPHSSHFCSLAVGSFVTTQRPAAAVAIGNQSLNDRNSVNFLGLTDPQANEFQSLSTAIVTDFPITKVQYSPHRVSTN